MGKLVIGTNKNVNSTPSIVRDMSPERYLEFNVDSNGRLIHSNSSNIINLDGVSALDEEVLYYAYENNTSLTGILNLDSLVQLDKSKSCYHTFSGCTNITSVSMKNLKKILGYMVTESMFYNCTGITSIDLSSLEEISGSYCSRSMFQNCTGLTGTIDLSKLKLIKGNISEPTTYMFDGCRNITKIDMSSLEKCLGSRGLNMTFRGCSSLIDIDLSSLTIVEDYGFVGAFENCGITTYNFPSLKILKGQYAFTPNISKNNTIIYFPALKTFSSATNQLSSLYRRSSVTGGIIHFPSNVQSTIEGLTGYPNFGGSDVTPLFDLPATVILTGANSQDYERNPKYDTQTSLAWRIKDTGSTNENLVIDWTPYYTSTISDPVVGDTIYSDSACTQVVTTISAIV